MRNACYKEGFFFFLLLSETFIIATWKACTLLSSLFYFYICASSQHHQQQNLSERTRRDVWVPCWTVLSTLFCFCITLWSCIYAALWDTTVTISLFWSFLRGNFDDACSIIEHAVSTHKEYVLDCSCSVPHDSAKQWDDWESEVKHLCWKHAKVQASSVTLRMLLTLLISFSRAFVRHWKDGIDIYEKSGQQYTLHKM